MSEKQADQNFKNRVLQSERSKFLFRNILNKSQDLICIVDMDGYFKYTNPAWEKIIGYTESELLSKPIFDFMHPDDHKISDDEIGKLMAGQYTIDFENRYIHKDNSIRRISWRATPDPETQLIYCIGRDITRQAQLTKELDEHRSNLEDIVKRRTAELQQEITERKRTEDVLYRSEILLKSSIESPKDMIILSLDSKYRYLYFNKTHLETMSHVYGSLPQAGDCIFDHVNVKGDIKKLKTHYDRSLSGDGHIAIEEYGEGKSRYYYEVQYNPIYDGKNKILGITVFAKDITERKRVEEELKESEKRFRDISLSMADWIWETNSETKFTYISQNIKDVLGYAPEELIGKTPFDLMPKDESVRVKEIVSKIVSKSENIKDLENWNIDKAGHRLFMLTSGIPILDNEGKTRGYRGVNKNITDQRKLETQLHQAQKMESIGTLAGGIAHDFNNILFPIIGHTEMMLDDVPEDSPFRDGLNHVYSGALRASELVKQILTFARQESGELKLMKIQSILKEALKLIRSTIPTTIDIKQYIRNDCGIIKADPTQIHQIVMNLATNAYHAMQDTGGVLTISLKEIELGKLDLINPDMIPGVYACLSVADTGKGMDKNLTEKIFDPFFTTKEKGKGTGMGLSVVHGIVTGMKGTIKVYSEPGKGTEFNIYLPVVQSLSEKEEINQTKEPIQGGIERILLVDDEKAILTIEKQMLERLGYQVTSLVSSIEALEAFRDNSDKFDLVITDMSMPNMPGDKLSIELTKIRPDIPILLCTGFSETMSEEQALSLGIKGFILKPIVMKDLAQKIREVLDKN